MQIVTLVVLIYCVVFITLYMSCQKFRNWLKEEGTPSASHNTGRQCVLQMPPSCTECVIKNWCNETYGTVNCDSKLWRHFSRA